MLRTAYDVISLGKFCWIRLGVKGPLWSMKFDTRIALDPRGVMEMSRAKRELP